MVRDPNYGRYAGIKSLADNRKRRPFRVDEHGDVICKDVAPATDGSANPAKRNQAGILDWDEADRRLDERSASATGDIVATASRGASSDGRTRSVATTRTTIGGIDYDVISANTYDPSLSNGKTAIPNADMIADKWQSAVTDGGSERATRIVRLPLDFSEQPDSRPPSERNLPLTSSKAEMYYSVPAVDAKAGSISGADTLHFDGVPGTVAFGHGHIDGTSDGMIDKWSPSEKTYGDIEPLRIDNPVPMATLSEGRVGWHQLDNGRLQFIYPSDSKFSEHEAEEIQKNLDRQQSLFHRRRE